MKIAKVKNTATNSEVFLPITSDDKPDIPNEMQDKWQKIVDLAAKMIGVPSGLITKLYEHELEIFLTNKDEKNIFVQNSKLELGLGWYCETTAAIRDENIIHNALTDEKWNNNPSIPFGMVSYCGIPIIWPDGEVFGTFCMLDNKEKECSEYYKEILHTLRDIIQNDLELVLMYKKAQQEVLVKEAQLRELHHRIKNHFNLLIASLRLQSFLGSQSSIETVLADIESRIKAISDIHDHLNRSMNLEKVILGEYLDELGKHIVELLGDKKINYTCSWSKLEVSSKISVPCGLILNELITNSLKYAFENIEKPEITVSVKQENKGSATIIYRDNGSGLPESYNIEDSNSLGLLLLKQSVFQIGGTYEVKNDNGFVFRMEFKT